LHEFRAYRQLEQFAGSYVKQNRNEAVIDVWIIARRTEENAIHEHLRKVDISEFFSKFELYYVSIINKIGDSSNVQIALESFTTSPAHSVLALEHGCKGRFSQAHVNGIHHHQLIVYGALVAFNRAG
jgi:hypothetical protein